MQTKLTLKLDSDLIQRGKKYAIQHQTSLSALVGEFFKSMSRRKKTNNQEEISPLVKELSGVLKIEKEIDEDKLIKKHLSKKYLN